ncbi:peptidase C1A papain [Catenulispora acidiphila DSM 44928]|uniref:Peptidase C1A papain n=1 Tax=Catenulispora acidiphila (strain DSM 44928 / JCM 14897 / NBRC 102108 / NRRL B-24433 / ID139908) TaxID=479433 RepID=C7QAC2_CATAD|nr:C1 family peptidase [Catenulispora acidiphila]ACU72421.1 peptidase C1A papain [Catenulispora acidiphila DSM 44928]
MHHGKTVGIAAAFATAAALTGVAAAPASASAEQSGATHHRHFATGLNIAQARAAERAGMAAQSGHSAQLVQLRGLRTADGLRADVPDSASLQQYALSPGDQGQVGSCVTWATGYSAYGILMNEQGISGDPMAPMYIYAQIAQGNDEGTNGDVALGMEQDQGIDTNSDYYQGSFDYTTQPDANERANAAHYKLSGYQTLPVGGGSEDAIKSAISQGLPVSVGFNVRQSFMDLSAQDASNYSYQPGDDSSDPVVGGHEVAVIAYTDQGVTIENSWGSSWAADGYVTVPWSFFSTGDVDELYAVGKLTQG